MDIVTYFIALSALFYKILQCITYKEQTFFAQEKHFPK